MSEAALADRPIVLFTGPTLPPGDAAAMIDADVRPPAAQGDLIAAVLEIRPSAIGLIDGVFQSQPAVRHKEILWAIDLGIPVFGAASMGALRAAELNGFGMIGVGLIYRWYRRNALAPDDAVAVLHGPAELGATSLSDSLVDLRMTFKSCRRRGILNRETEHALVMIAGRLPYRARTRSAVLDAAHAAGIGPLPEIADIDRCWRDQKRADAEALVRNLAACRTQGLWPSTDRTAAFEFTDAWVDDLVDAGFSLDDLPARL